MERPPTDDGATSNVSQVVIGGETTTSIREAMERNNEDDDIRTDVLRFALLRYEDR